MDVYKKRLVQYLPKTYNVLGEPIEIVQGNMEDYLIIYLIHMTIKTQKE